jgi:hypothetical protein
MTSMLLISVLQPGKAKKAQHDKLRSLALRYFEWVERVG